MKLKCKCGQVMDLGAEHVGRAVSCPKCGKVHRIPRSAGGASPPGDEAREPAPEGEFEMAEPEAPGAEVRPQRPRMRQARGGVADEGAPVGSDEQEFGLLEPETASAQAGPRREEAGAPEGDALAGFGEEDFELDAPQSKDEEAAEAPPGPGVPPPVVVVEAAAEEEEVQHDSIISLFWMCLHGASFIGVVDEAIARRKVLLLQIVALFAVLVIIPAVMETRGSVAQYDSTLIAFESRLVLKALEFGVALVVVYFFSVVTGAGVPFVRMAGVLLFIRVMASVLVVGLAGLGVVSHGLYKIGLGMHGGWQFALGLSFWVYIGVAIFYQIKLFQSRSNISFFGGLMVNAPILIAYWLIETRFLPTVMQALGLWSGEGAGAYSTPGGG